MQNVKMLCVMLDLKPTNVCKDSGVVGSFISDIKRGQTPSAAKVQMLANYLGVTTSELLGEVPMGGIPQARAAPTLPDSGLSDLEQAMLHSFRQLNDEGQKRGIEYLGDLLASGRYSSEGGGERLA